MVAAATKKLTSFSLNISVPFRIFRPDPRAVLHVNLLVMEVNDDNLLALQTICKQYCLYYYFCMLTVFGITLQVAPYRLY